MSYRYATIYINDRNAGVLEETDEGYEFRYHEEYVDLDGAEPVSLTLPVMKEPYRSKTLFSFFDGLIPEGWLLDVVEETWKVNSSDRMGLLLVSCKDCIGNVSVIDPSDNNMDEVDDE